MEMLHRALNILEVVMDGAPLYKGDLTKKSSDNAIAETRCTTTTSQCSGTHIIALHTTTSSDS
jgi:hypothetical protein